MLKNHKNEIEEYMKNHTIKEGAYEFGVTYQALSIFLKKNNINYLKYTSPFGDMSEADIMKFCEDKTVSEIAFFMHTDNESISKYLYAHRVKHKIVHRRMESIKTKQEMFKFLAQKFSYASIAEQFNVSRQYVEAICKERY